MNTFVFLEEYGGREDNVYVRFKPKNGHTHPMDKPVSSAPGEYKRGPFTYEEAIKETARMFVYGCGIYNYKTGSFSDTLDGDVALWGGFMCCELCVIASKFTGSSPKKIASDARLNPKVKRVGDLFFVGDDFVSGQLNGSAKDAWWSYLEAASIANW